MVKPETNLDIVARLVAESRGIVADQRALIARLQSAGRPTQGHKKLLETFEDSLACIEGQERLLREKVGET